MAHTKLGRFLILILILTCTRVGNAEVEKIYPLQNNQASGSQLELSLEQFTMDLTRPVGLVNSGVSGDHRLFAIEQAGLLEILDDYGTVNTQPFLDITDRVASGGEMGLLGLAFHPNYQNNGYFYVKYNSGSDSNWQTRLSRFQVTADPDIADPSSENIMLTVSQPGPIHNAGPIHFGPNGYLYVPLGDAGASPYAQDMSLLLGKVVRIDVDGNVGGPPDCKQEGSGDYTIPNTNPFIDGSGGACDEIWASGLRNPWRSSFDRETGDLYIADVGQSFQEEVNMQPAASGGGENYGWPCYEGTEPYNTTNCGPIEDYDSPIFTYGHSGIICAVAGGYVYRGLRYPAMVGHYLLADICSGDMWNLFPDGEGGWISQQTPELGPAYASASFGEDINGELYLASLTGTIYRIRENTDHLYLSLPLISAPGVSE